MSDEYNYHGAMADLDELIRVARDKSPEVLKDFLMCNYPEEMGLSKEEHRKYLSEDTFREPTRHGAPQDAVDGGDLVEKMIAYYSATPHEIKEIPSLSFDEAAEQMFNAIYPKLEDDHLPKEFNDGVIKEVAKIAIRALTANGDVLIRRE